jgi:hypothetical protein
MAPCVAFARLEIKLRQIKVFERGVLCLPEEIGGLAGCSLSPR